MERQPASDSIAHPIRRETVLPQVLAMVVCDDIHNDPWTGKRTILGVFTAVRPTSYPVVLPRFAVYLTLTECRGDVPIRIRVIDVDEERTPVFDSGDLRVNGPNPVGIIEVDVRINGAQIPAAGYYLVQLFSYSTPICERRLLFC